MPLSATSLGTFDFLRILNSTPYLTTPHAIATCTLKTRIPPEP